jgi:ABC-type branched-subunit amino acid transport system ATPase component
VTDARIVEFQRLSMLRQQEHLDEALRRMREAERRAAELLAELELAHEHNTVLVAMAQRDRRLLQALRAEMAQVRGILGEELR